MNSNYYFSLAGPLVDMEKAAQLIEQDPKILMRSMKMSYQIVMNGINGIIRKKMSILIRRSFHRNIVKLKKTWTARRKFIEHCQNSFVFWAENLFTCSTVIL